MLHLQSVPKPRELFKDFQKIARWMLQTLGLSSKLS